MNVKILPTVLLGLIATVSDIREAYSVKVCYEFP